MPEAILDKTYRRAALGMARKLQNCGLPKFDPHLEGHSPQSLPRKCRYRTIGRFHSKAEYVRINRARTKKEE